MSLFSAALTLRLHHTVANASNVTVMFIHSRIGPLFYSHWSESFSSVYLHPFLASRLHRENRVGSADPEASFRGSNDFRLRRLISPDGARSTYGTRKRRQVRDWGIGWRRYINEIWRCEWASIAL